MPKKIQPKQETVQKELYTSNLEAHIIADMLRIEGITTELREFKEDTKKRFDKLEGWLVGIVAISFTSLVGIAGTLVFRVLG